MRLFNICFFMALWLLTATANLSKVVLVMLVVATIWHTIASISVLSPKAYSRLIQSYRKPNHHLPWAVDVLCYTISLAALLLTQHYILAALWGFCAYVDFKARWDYYQIKKANAN